MISPDFPDPTYSSPYAKTPSTGSHELYTRYIDPTHAAVFCRVAEEWGGLSNMSRVFSLNFHDRPVRTVEAIYQSLKYPSLPKIQEDMINQASPMIVKRISRANRSSERKDWMKIRELVMWWCLREKLSQNFDSFGEYLLKTDDKIIIELSVRDSFWGMKPLADMIWRGENRLGFQLTRLRDLLKSSPDEMKKGFTPDLEDFTFLGKPLTGTGV